MAVVVTPPFPFFVDRAGDPLDAGFVYVGAANLDPVTYPIAIFWDAGLTIPAPNPVRTSAGYLARTGAPGSLFAADDYSIRVCDKGNTQIYSVPSTARTDLGDIILQAGESLTARSGASVRIEDGAQLRIGTDTGVAARLVMADNARVDGDLVSDGGGSLGTDADPWADVQADAAHIDVLDVNVDESHAGVTITSTSGGSVKAADLLAKNSLTSQIGGLTAPWASAAIKSTTANRVGVRDINQPTTDPDLARVSARGLVVACGHYTAGGGLQAEHYNVASVVDDGGGTYTITLDVAVSTDSAVVVTPHGGPSQASAIINTGGLTITVGLYLPAGAASVGSFYFLVVGPGNATGSASIPQLPI